MNNAPGDVRCLQPFADSVLNRLLIQPGAAGEDIHRGKGVLGPGVNGDVGFGNDDDAADAMGAEIVEDLRHNGAIPRAHGIEEQGAKGVRIFQERGIAPVKLEQRMNGEGGKRVRRHS